MLMQYTGRDGDLGLKTNDNYHVVATTDHNRWSICVYIYEINSTYPIFLSLWYFWRFLNELESIS